MAPDPSSSQMDDCPPTVKAEVNSLLQHAEYTSRQNVGEGRHSWIRLVPAFSVHLADELIRSAPATGTILDPFGGSGTTLLCAATLGRRCVSLEINPFLTWLQRAKTTNYSPSAIAE